MKYDFTSYLDRHNMDALAVDPGEDSEYRSGFEMKPGFDHIPMWVADMNFPTCPTVTDALIERAKHPLYGYFEPREEYYSSIIEWHEKRNGVTGLKKEYIGYENSVVGGIISALHALCSMGEKILLHSPTYIGFTYALQRNGYNAIHSPLVKDKDGIWRMDYEDMDKKLKEHHIHCAIFCSPHNPSGRVWEKWEIEKALEIYKNNHCYVISDEIWSDILLNGSKHTPTQLATPWAKDMVIAEYAASKTFNLAGIVGSYHIIYNDYLRDRVRKEDAISNYNEMNLFNMYTIIGAYKPEGHEWADELCQVLSKNINYGYDFIKENFKGVEISKPQGTYLLYLYCEGFLKDKGIDIEELLKRGYSVGVDWQDGRPFFGENTIRMNLALPYDKVAEAFDRLRKYVFV